MKKPALSKTSKRLLNTFDQAAQDHGWDRDQGSAQAAFDSANAHSAAYAALEKRILSLETSLKKARGTQRYINSHS